MNFFRRFRNENDEESPLLIDAEAQNLRGNRSSFKGFSLSEIEFSFESINETLPSLSKFESLKVTQCPKFESTLESIPFFMRGFFTRFNSALCLHFVIDDFVEDLNPTLGFFNIFESVNIFSYSFVFIFEKKTDNSSLIYWRVKESLQIFSLLAMENSSRLSDFLKEFLVNCLKNGHNGICSQMQDYVKNKIQVPIIQLTSLANREGLNLLHLAARDGKLELVDFLLDFFGMSYEVKAKIAIDFAYEAKHFDVVHLLLEENSRFPRDFQFSTSMPEKLKTFAEMSQKLHESIKREDETAVEEIVVKNKCLKFFYDSQSRSALNVALTSGAFDIYKLLIDKNCPFGPHEIFKDLLRELSESQRKELTAINESMYKRLEDEHILMLMSNTQVGPDDKQARLGAVHDALQKLNKVSGIKILLQIVAATRNFQLIFDFNHDHIHFLQPAEEGYVTGLFDDCGRIYIGAKHLLNASRAHEVLGVIAHELCHFVMWTVFNNSAKPYEVKDEGKRERFEQILRHSKVNHNLEEIIALVFNEYGPEMHVAELIVRAPHALGLYINQPEKLEEFKENFAELNNFYGEVIETMQAKLPKIEEEAENRIRKESSSPLNFVKYHWKKILLGLFLMALAAFSITLLARSCFVKDCGDLRAFCDFERFTAVCKCQQDADETLFWDHKRCVQCLIDENCHKNQTCFVNSCHSSRNVFTCHNDSIKMFSTVRCNGIKDCADGSDESYHCIYGKLTRNESFFKYYSLNVSLYDDDYLIFIDGSTSDCERFEIGSTLIQYLPANLSKTFHKLKEIEGGQKQLEKITFENFWGLKELERLALNENQITLVDDAFRELIALRVLLLNTNMITSLHKFWFENLKNLEEFDISNNHIETLEDGVFDNLVKLRSLNVGKNFILTYNDNVFDHLIQLESLTFASNFFSHLKPKIFENHKKLKILDMKSNWLKNLTFSMFNGDNVAYEIGLSSSYLTYIDKNTFKDCTNLHDILIAKSNLSEIPYGTFRHLNNLVTLDFSENQIEELNENIFEDLTSLVILYVSSNNLSTLPDNLLRNLEKLEYFDASDNRITSLKTILFQNNKVLKSADFSGNGLMRIEENFIDNLKQLRYLSLWGNFCTGNTYERIPYIDDFERNRFKKDVRERCNKTLADVDRLP